MDSTLGRNTKEKGKFTLFVYKEKPNYYIGVCLEFDLLIEGESLVEAMQQISKVANDYLQIVIENNWSDDLLNQSAPKEYWKKFFEFLKELRGKERKRQYWERYLREQLYTPDFLKKHSVIETCAQ